MSQIREIHSDKDGRLSSKRIYGAIGLICMLIVFSVVVITIVDMPLSVETLEDLKKEVKVYLDKTSIELVLGSIVSMTIVFAVLIGGGSLENIISSVFTKKKPPTNE